MDDVFLQKLWSFILSQRNCFKNKEVSLSSKLQSVELLDTGLQNTMDGALGC